MNLLRDSTQLQTHLRMFDHLVNTRHTILRLKPNPRQNWVALAVAHHLNGNLPEARKILEHYLRSLKVTSSYPTPPSTNLLFLFRTSPITTSSIQKPYPTTSSKSSRSSMPRRAPSSSIALPILTYRAHILSKQHAPK